MKIFMEKLSKNGNFNTVEYEDVTMVMYQGRIRLERATSPGLILKHNGGRSSVTFPTADKARLAQRLCQTSDPVIWALNMFFEERVSQEKANTLVKSRLVTHLNICVNKIMLEEPIQIEDLLLRPAFKFFDYVAIAKGTFDVEYTEEMLEVFSKTLYTPKEYLRIGLTPMQYYKALK